MNLTDGRIIENWDYFYLNFLWKRGYFW